MLWQLMPRYRQLVNGILLLATSSDLRACQLNELRANAITFG